jgi:HK97 gp10 family phage protein
MAKRDNFTMHLEGVEELNNALREIGDRATGLALRKAAEAGAEVIADEAKQRAPVKTGQLRESITVAPGPMKQGKAEYRIGPGKKAWYGSLIEFGTKFIPARPFLRPALDVAKDEAQEAVTKSLRHTLRDVL